MTARRALLDGLARDAGIFEVLDRPRTAERQARYAILAAAGVHGGTAPDLLAEVAWWQAGDLWQSATYAAVAGIRAAASRAGVPVRQACQDLNERPGHPVP